MESCHHLFTRHHMEGLLKQERSKLPQQPLAFASCKKLPQADSYYSWSLQAGDTRLLGQIKIIYQEFFHQKGGKVPCLAVIADELRIGLLLVGLSTEEQKAAEPPLSIYLEFDERDASSVFQAAAALLSAYDDDMYPEHLQHFWTYSRQVPAAKKVAPLSQAPTLALPKCPGRIDAEHTFLSSEVALPSIRHNRRKCACYLQKLSESDNAPAPLILISAGRVERDTLQKFANEHTTGKLIVLTLSATVQDELDLRSTAERYIPETIRERIMTTVKKLFSTR